MVSSQRATPLSQQRQNRSPPLWRCMISSAHFTRPPVRVVPGVRRHGETVLHLTPDPGSHTKTRILCGHVTGDMSHEGRLKPGSRPQKEVALVKGDIVSVVDVFFGVRFPEKIRFMLESLV